MRTLVALAAVLTGLLLVPVGRPADAADGGGRTVTVGNERQYRDALAALSQDDGGPHTLVLARDIALTRAGGVPTYRGTRPLTVRGRGFSLSGAQDGALLQHLSSQRLTVTDLVLRDSTAGILSFGPTVVRRSAFIRLGAPRRTAFGAVEVLRLGVDPKPATLLVTESVIGAVRSAHGGPTVKADGTLTIRRSRLVGLRSGTGIVVSGRRGVRLDRTSIEGAVATNGVIRSRATITLTDSRVVRSAYVAGRPGQAPTLAAPRVELIRSVLAANASNGPPRDRVAVSAADLVVRRSVILHEARHCWVTGTVRWSSSLTDRSCRTARP